MFGFGGNNKRGHGPIGLAVTAEDVRLSQRVAGGRYTFEIEPLAGVTDPSDPSFHTETSRAIATAVRRGKFVGKDVVSALPAQMLQYKTLRLPPMPPEDLVQAIAWEAAERFQLTDDQALQHYDAGEVQQGNERREEVILLAAEKRSVHDHATAVKRAGLNPVAIDATGAALTRVLGEEGRSTLVVHLGTDIAEIVGATGDRVIFDKPVDLTRADDQLDTQALARELSLCLRYMSVTFGVHKPNTAWVCGEGVDPTLAHDLGNLLHLPVQTVDEAPAMREVRYPGADASTWVIALGLAKRDQQGHAQRGAA